MAFPRDALVTRDLLTFKRVNTPIAHIHNALFALLQDQQSIALRAAFACCLSSELQRSSMEDEALIEHFEQPPQLALLQGSIDPSQVFNQWSTSKGTSSGGSSASTATRHESTGSSTSSLADRRANGSMWTQDLAPDDVRECIFFPWNIHSAVCESKTRGDMKELTEAAMFVLASLLYEVAHWLYERTHGHRTRPSLKGFKGSSMELERIMEERKSRDVGMKVLTAVLGSDFELITTADGVATLAKIRLPAAHPPILTFATTSSLIGYPAPKVLDATAFGSTRVGSTPKWLNTLFAVIKVESVGASCHHGITDVEGGKGEKGS